MYIVNGFQKFKCLKIIQHLKTLQNRKVFINTIAFSALQWKFFKPVMCDKSNKTFLKSKTSEFLGNKRNGNALRSIVDNFKVSVYYSNA